MDRQDVIAKLKRLMARHGFVSHAYLFGSVAEGRAGPLSDIDIAVSFKPGMGKREAARRKLSLINAISSLLKTDNFDLVLMGGAKLSLKHSIIKGGILLKDSPLRPAEEAETMCMYLDMKHYNDLYDSSLVERVAARGIL